MVDYVQELRELVGTRPLILIGAAVIVLNQDNKILLQQRPDEDWGLPGGLMDLGESLEETAKREVKEETGLYIGDLQLLHVFSGPEYFIKVKNGDEFYSVTALYISRKIKAGNLVADGVESLRVAFFNLDELPDTLKKNYKTYLTPYIKQIKEKLL